MTYNEKLILNEYNDPDKYNDLDSPEQHDLSPDQFGYGNFNNLPLLLGDYDAGDDDEPEEDDS